IASLRRRSRVVDSGVSKRSYPGYENGRTFFFQAEDGIRDLIVTGVQTCALPIFNSTGRREARLTTNDMCETRRHLADEFATDARSEERRVGKECRSRWGA